MTLSKAERSKRELHGRRHGAVQAGLYFAVRHNFDGKPYDPPQFFASLPEAEDSATVILSRVNSADGADVHARPDDLKRCEVWIEHFSEGAWTRANGNAMSREGFFDTTKRHR